MVWAGAAVVESPIDAVLRPTVVGLGLLLTCLLVKIIVLRLLRARRTDGPFHPEITGLLAAAIITGTCVYDVWGRFGHPATYRLPLFTVGLIFGLSVVWTMCRLPWLHRR